MGTEDDLKRRLLGFWSDTDKIEAIRDNAEKMADKIIDLLKEHDYKSDSDAARHTIDVSYKFVQHQSRA